MEARNTNDKWWNINTQLRDDGTITIGTIFQVVNPNPVQKLLSDQLSMLDTRTTVMEMNHPNIIPEMPATYLVTGNNSRSFSFLKNCELQVLSLTPEEKMCWYFLRQT